MYKTKEQRFLNKRRKTLKLLNCSPIVKNKTAHKSTCYTNKLLLNIRDAYNKQPQYKNKQIRSTNTKEILYQLRKNLHDICEHEKCWLKFLSTEQQRVINEMVFSPEKPAKWKKNPFEWLSNYDILNVLKQYEESNPRFKFIGPTPIDFDTVIQTTNMCVLDDLCRFSLKKYIDSNIDYIGIIFNLDKHTQSGSHWVSMFIDLKNSFIFYFDSATNKTPNEIKILVDKIQTQAKELGISLKYFENYPNNHQRSNTECGMYSLYFIITMLDEKKSVTSKIRLFKEKKISDSHMRNLRNIYFN